MLYFYIGLSIYIVLISFTAIVVTVRDKKLAKNNKWRIKERTLLLISAFGGSIAMLITMRIIRHKTKRLKFMAGIPVIIIVQLILIAGLLYWGI